MLLTLCACGAAPGSEAQGQTAQAASQEAAAFELSAEAIAALALDDWLPGECLVAVIERDGQTLLAYGLAEPVDGKDQFLFVELFTGTPLFRFDGQDNGEFPRYYRSGGTIGFEPLDPVMEGPVTLRTIDNFGCDGNYFGRDGGPYEHGIATLRDAGDRYFNLIPAEMRLVSVDPGAGKIVWGETPYELLNGEDAYGVPEGISDDYTNVGAEPPQYDEQITGYVFQDLPEEEFAAAYEKLHIADPDETLNAGKFFTAGLYVDGEPRILYGVVAPTGEDGVFTFKDLFTRQDLFVYRTSNPNGDLRTIYGQEYTVPYYMRRVEFEGIHPFFLTDDIELCYVDLSIQTFNFLCSLGYNVADNFAFYHKYIPGNSEVIWTIHEYAQSYLNFIPKSMWITAEDLE